MARAKAGNEKAVVAGLLAVAAAVSLALLVLPGREGLELRISLLFMPWGAVALGLGTLWLTRKPHLEDAVGKGLLALAALVAVGVVAAAALN